jgi:hypothetical protein
MRHNDWKKVNANALANAAGALKFSALSRYIF